MRQWLPPCKPPGVIGASSRPPQTKRRNSLVVGRHSCRGDRQSGGSRVGGRGVRGAVVRGPSSGSSCSSAWSVSSLGCLPWRPCPALPLLPPQLRGPRSPGRRGGGYGRHRTHPGPGASAPEGLWVRVSGRPASVLSSRLPSRCVLGMPWPSSAPTPPSPGSPRVQVPALPG